MSSTEYKISVMQASLKGEQIQNNVYDKWYDNNNPTWNWEEYNYRVKPKSSFVDRLFKDAPIMQMDISTRHDVPPKWEPKKFKYKNASEAYDVELKRTEQTQGYWDYTRLPIIEEAPVNTWLVPWDEQPKELKDLPDLVNCGTNIISYYASNCTIGQKWTSVKAIMIVGGL